MKAIAVVSGGLDSVTLAYLLRAEGCDLHMLFFDYGQRHRKELDYAALCARRLGAAHTVVDIGSLRPLLQGSALTDDVPVPDGHYAAPSMAATVVPNRNAIMLSIAYAAAVSDGAERVAVGVHAGDHFIYPDCRPAFIGAFAEMERLATEGYAQDGLALYAPFLHMSKTDIVTTAARLGVPFADTWSCYKGGALHCGACGTCVERREAFHLAGIDDPTQYGE